MKPTLAFLITMNILFYQLGCGVKSKPLAPLKEPWISKGNVEKDREKKFKTKKQTAPENRVELNTAPAAAPEAEPKNEL